MTNLIVKPMNSDVTIHRLSAYPAVGNVMEILTALDMRTKKIVKNKHVKIGNLIVDRVNVFSNPGNVTEKMIALQVCVRVGQNSLDVATLVLEFSGFFEGI